MAEKLRSFRWLGVHGPNDLGVKSGVLHIMAADAQRIVVDVGGIVKKTEHLAALGAERIEEFVKAGYAEYLDVLDKLGVEELLNRGVKSDTTPEEAARNQKTAQDAVSQSVGMENLARNQPRSAAVPASSGASLGSSGLVTTPGGVPAAPAPGGQAQPGAAGPKE